jgi:hypothetical protein
MSIKNLYEISSLVTNWSNKSNSLSVDNEDFEANLKYKRLIEGLTKEQWDSDEDARNELYGMSAGLKTYDMLKSRAKDKLVSLIFQSDSKKLFENSKDRAYYNACKNFLSGHLLFTKMKFSSGQEQLKLALKTSREFEFFDIELLALRSLRRFSSFSGNEKQYQKLSTEIAFAKSNIDAEIEAEELELELQTFLVNSVDISALWLEKLERNYSRMKVLYETNNINSVRVNFYKISMRYHQAKEDYNKSIETAEEYGQ